MEIIPWQGQGMSCPADNHTKDFEVPVQANETDKQLGNMETM